MPDLNQIIDLRPLPDHGIADGAAIDRRIGADLDGVLYDDASGLRNLDGPCLVGQKSKSVLTDPAPRMDDDAVADQRVHDRGAGADRAVAPDPYTRPYHGIRSNHRARADLGAGPDHGARIDRDAVLDTSGRVHRGSRRDAFGSEQRRRTQRGRKKRARDRDERAIGLGNAQHGDVARHVRLQSRRHQAGAGARRGKLAAVFGVIKKGTIGRRGAIERRHIADRPIEIGASVRLRAGQ